VNNNNVKNKKNKNGALEKKPKIYKEEITLNRNI